MAATQKNTRKENKKTFYPLKTKRKKNGKRNEFTFPNM
jgi:hypothetical protein